MVKATKTKDVRYWRLHGKAVEFEREMGLRT